MLLKFSQIILIFFLNFSKIVVTFGMKSEKRVNIVGTTNSGYILFLFLLLSPIEQALLKVFDTTKGSVEVFN